MSAKIPVLKHEPRWIPPDGLDHSPPRLWKLTGGGRALILFSFLLAIGGVVAGIGLGAAAARGAAESALLRDEGTEAVARVERIFRAGKESDQRRLTYSFQAEGRTYHRELRVPARVWRHLRAGDPVAVRYVASRPEVNYPLGLGPGRVAAWLPVPVTLAFCAVGLLLVLPLCWQKRLLVCGRVAEGTVTGLGKVQRSSHGKEIGTQFFYEFRRMSGAVVTGKAVARSAPGIGDRITVLYDRERPRRSAIYPLPLVRTAYK